MKESEALEQIVCVKHCAYYKPGKNEGIRCKGFGALQRLSNTGRKISAHDAGKAAFDGRIKKVLTDHLCRGCPFYREDCDFILTEGKALPCGGFILLTRLLKEGVITIDEVR